MELYVENILEALIIIIYHRILELIIGHTDATLPSITADDNGSSLIAYNGQWIVANNGKLFQYNISAGTIVWNYRTSGYSKTPISENLGNDAYSYIALDPSSDFSISGYDTKDSSIDASLSFPTSAVVVKGNSRTIGPSSLSYVNGCYATLSFTSDSTITLQVGFSGGAQRTSLYFGAGGALIFRAYI